MQRDNKNIILTLMLGVLGLLLAHSPVQAQGSFTYLALQNAQPNPILVGQTITLTGSAFPANPIVYLLPTDNPFASTKVAKVSSASNNQVVAQLPTLMCEGKYDILIQDAQSSYQTNLLPIVVKASTPPLYDITLSKITCIKESHDVSASDEVYFFGLTYNLAQNIMTTSSSDLYDHVNAGNTLDISAAYKLSLLSQPIADPAQSILECALAECDNYHWNFILDIQTWDKSWGVLQRDFGAWKADNARADVLSKYALQFMSPSYSRDYKSALMQVSMQNSINQMTGDDVLGLFELKFTPEQVEIARKAFGQPYLKVVDVYGDSSHYRLQFLLTRVQ